MDELTMTLFADLVEVSELSDELKTHISEYLSAVIAIPHLTKDEKSNCLNLVEYIETVFNYPEINRMITAVKTKLKMIVRKPWDGIEFPDNVQFNINDEMLTPDDIKARGVPYVEHMLTNPIRVTPESIRTYRTYSDGRIEILTDYDVYPPTQIGEFHVFNTCGEKAIQQVNNLNRGDDCNAGDIQRRESDEDCVCGRDVYEQRGGSCPTEPLYQE